MSKETGALLDLLHVANLTSLERLQQLMLENAADLHQQVLEAARERLAELAAALLKRYGVAANTHVVAGAVLAELAKEVDARAPSLIVCGATGENIIRRLML